MSDRSNGFEAAVNVLLGTPTCTQCWLGYADVLFVGFGDFLPPKEVREHPWKHIPTQYELQTNLCDWEINFQGKQIGSSYDDPKAPFAAHLLIGRRLQSWKLLGSAKALFQFDDNTTLMLMPYEEEEFKQRDAWGVRDDTGWYNMIRCNDETYRIHEDSPKKP